MAEDPTEVMRETIRNRYPRFIAYGVDYNDAERVLGRIRDWSEWCREWAAEGEARAREGEEALKRGRRLTAGEHFVRAALLCHFGALVFLDDPAQRKAAMARKVELYRRALPLLDPPGERVEIPYGHFRIPGVLRKPRGASRPPFVIIVPGADSTKEEFNALEPEFLRRGIATLAIDGPGQGESAPHAPVPHDYERAVGAVIDHIEGRGDLDAGRVGIFGRSLGGYLGARAAAFEGRLKSCVSAGGIFDMIQFWESCPPRVHENIAHCFHIEDLKAAKEHGRKYTLRGAAERIRCPLLIVHGDKDPYCPVEGAREFFAIAGSSDKEIVVFEGGDHVCDNMPYRYRPLVADWTAEKLGAAG